MFFGSVPHTLHVRILGGLKRCSTQADCITYCGHVWFTGRDVYVMIFCGMVIKFASEVGVEPQPFWCLPNEKLACVRPCLASSSCNIVKPNSGRAG